jgi:phosphatidylinositol 3,5-bisphosphate 5-phosphatase
MSGYLVSPKALTSDHCRYVDQCQELIEAAVDRKDRIVYQTAARMATGETINWQDDVADEAFLNYVERGTTQHLDNAGRKDALPVAFNYERWIGGLGQRIS